MRDIETWITVCEVRPEETPPLADHFSIVTHVDFLVPRSASKRPWNFRATDWVSKGVIREVRRYP
jgi:hypothetical protein